MNRLLTIFVVVGAIGIGSTSEGGDLVSWDFSTLDQTGLADNSPIANPILTADFANAAAGLTSSSLTNNGLFATTGNPVFGEANMKNWDLGGDGTNDNYMEFTITADVAGTLNVDSISISQWRNGGGAPNGIAFDVSVDGGDYSLYDAIQTDPDAGDFGFDTFVFSQPIAGAETVGVRFTPRNNGVGSTGNLHINGLTVTGSVVPEPSTFVLTAIGLLGLLERSRRRKK